jgi:hypothetical protein
VFDEGKEEEKHEGDNQNYQDATADRGTGFPGMESVEDGGATPLKIPGFLGLAAEFYPIEEVNERNNGDAGEDKRKDEEGKVNSHRAWGF